MYFPFSMLYKMQILHISLNKTEQITKQPVDRLLYLAEIK